MAHLTYKECYADEVENYYLPDFAGSSTDKVDRAELLKENSVFAMEHLTYEECYTDEIENYYLPDAAASSLGKAGGVRRGKDCYTSTDFEKVELLKKNLGKIIENFKKCKESSEKFLEKYPSWNDKRQKVIAELREIAKGLDRVKKDSNVAKIVGSCVGATGGIATVVGAALIPVTMGVSTTLMISGIATSSLGGATSLGTAVTEICLLKQKIKAAQTLVEKDKEEFGDMSEWFNNTEAYINAVESFLGLNVVAKLGDSLPFHEVLTGKSKVKTSCSSLPSTVSKFFASSFSLPQFQCGNEKLLAVAKNMLPRNLHGFLIPLSTIIMIAANPDLGKMLQEIMQLHHGNPVLYEAISMFYRAQIIWKQADMLSDCIACVTTTAKFGTMTASAAVGQAVCQTVFAGFGLAIDVVSLILTSIDFHKGSHCNSAESLRKVIEQLSSASDIIESVYIELCK